MRGEKCKSCSRIIEVGGRFLSQFCTAREIPGESLYLQCNVFFLQRSSFRSATVECRLLDSTCFVLFDFFYKDPLNHTHIALQKHKIQVFLISLSHLPSCWMLLSLILPLFPILLSSSPPTQCVVVTQAPQVSFHIPPVAGERCC